MLQDISFKMPLRPTHRCITGQALPASYGLSRHAVASGTETSVACRETQMFIALFTKPHLQFP